MYFIYIHTCIKNKYMDYKSFDIEDFASDPFFRKWVLEPDDESNFFWEKWTVQHQEKSSSIKKAILLVKGLSFDEETFVGTEKERLLYRIQKSIQVDSPRYLLTDSMPQFDRTKDTRSLIYRIAAGFIGIAIVASMLLYFYEKRLFNNSNHVAHTITKEITKGQKMKIYLPDGSIVNLNSSSKISYPENFTGNIREVVLSGEAFFEVASNPDIPFVVKSDGLITKVYGTTFNVSSYPDSDFISVSLVSGKVEVHASKGSMIVPLDPGQSARLNKATNEIYKEPFDYKSIVSWKDGILYFKESLIEEVFKRLEQWYGVNIAVENFPAGLKPINGSFDNESLNNVLMTLGHTVDFNYTINGNNVYIKFN